MNKREREWGWFTTLYEDDHSNHKMKKLYIYPGGKIVLQSHNEINKHWVIVKGNAKVQLNDRFFTVYENEYVYIPSKMVYQAENIGSDLLEIAETQYGTYLGEDDVVLYQPDYGVSK
jgi:mannose-1-phosphate guanylyltransferase/mannose-6-phosphate isomerase